MVHAWKTLRGFGCLHLGCFYYESVKVGAIVTLELLEQIQQAEQRAEEARQNATRQAREIVSAVEEANIAQQRQMAVELRELVQGVMDEARAKANVEIERLQAQNDAQNLALSAKAQSLREQAAQRIFERIVNDGHC